MGWNHSPILKWISNFIPNFLIDVLQWRHHGYDGLSTHQSYDCLLNRVFRRRSKKTSKPRGTGLCEGESRLPVNSPHKGPVTRKMFPFDDVIMSACVKCCVILDRLKTKAGLNFVKTNKNDTPRPSATDNLYTTRIWTHFNNSICSLHTSVAYKLFHYSRRGWSRG